MNRVRTYARVGRAALLFALAATLVTPALLAQADDGTVVIQGAERSEPVTPFRFEGDLRLLPRPQDWKPGDPVREIPRRLFPIPGSQIERNYATQIDPLLQRQLDTPTEASALLTFTGPSRNFAGISATGASPPDTVGDVGLNHYIQATNGGGTRVRIWDKAEPTPNELTTFTLDSLSTGGVCNNGLGDPIILYDQFADRWMISEFSSSGNNLCVYISQTGDPVNGGWFAYGFTAPSFPDYPKYAIWPTDANGGQGSFVVTANDGGPGIYALDRGQMLAGNAATFQRLSIPGLPGFGFESPTPLDVDGPTPPPANDPAIIMRHRDTENHNGPAAPGDLLEMWSFDVDWNNAGNTTLIQEASIDVAEFDSDLCGLTSFFCFPQPSGPTLDPLREVIMNRLTYIHVDGHNSIVGNLVTDVNGANLGGIRWFELRGSGTSWSLHQEGTYSIDSDSRWMGASAMDQSGNIGLAYNVSSTSTFPSLRYTGRLVDDPAGVMTQTETELVAGGSSSGTNRWGDYAAMGLDPADDCTFWFTGESTNNSGSWKTQVASFGFEACGCDLEPSALVVSAQDVGPNQIDVGWNDADLASVVEYIVERSRTAGGPYQIVATISDSSPGIAGGAGYFFNDTDVSGGIDYYYIVRASDGSSCKSDLSNEASETASGQCTLAPVFSGIGGIVEPQLNSCTLDLVWSTGTDECGGPLSYNIYRSTTSGFTPGAANLVASGLTTTAYSDFDQLVSGVIYYYVVRAVDGANGVEDQNNLKLFGTPRAPGGGTCTTTSSCLENPFVDVQPNATTACQNSGFGLSAVTTGGTGTFFYQWTRDGIDIPGATNQTYFPDTVGQHTYNVKVQAQSCPGFVFDGVDSDIMLVNTPFFDGVDSASNPQTGTCGVDVAWDPGTTVCDGPVRYFVYRDTTSPVVPTETNLVAAGVLGTSLTDSAGLANLTTYHYLVRAQDASTGQLEGNTVEVSVTPDGPGGGPQAVLDEDFENPANFANWTVTTGPGLHTCGEWALSSSAGNRPNGGSGSYALADNDCNPLFARTSTTLTSPSINVNLPNIINVMLEYDIFYNHNGGETGKVEVFDGSSWVTVWQDTNSDLNAHQAIDVTAQAAGNPNFQVRFDYQGAEQDRFFSVDDVQVIALIDSPCSTAAAGPAGVPDGGLGSNPLRGNRMSTMGTSIDLTWDSSSCTAVDYNLLYGDLANVSSATLNGSECSLGAGGVHTWNSVPAGDLFFVIVGTDGLGTESSWGRDGGGGERNGLSVSGECSTAIKDTSNVCP